MILYIQSPKCHKVLRQVLPFQGKTCLYEKYHEAITEIKYSLIDIDRSLELVNQMQLSGDVTLAIDAFSFRTFSGDLLGRFCNYKAAARAMDLILTKDYNDYEFVANDETREINLMGDENISEKEIFYTSGLYLHNDSIKII